MTTHRNATISMREAANMLGISRQRVHQLVQAGKLPGGKVYGRVRINRAAVIARKLDQAEREPATPVE